MTWRNRQAQDYLILDKSDNIQFRRCQDTVDRCVRIEASEFALVSCQQEIRTQVQHMPDPSEAALAPQTYRPPDSYLQARFAVRSRTPRDGILQFAVIIGQVIPQTLEAGNRHFTMDHSCRSE